MGTLSNLVYSRMACTPEMVLGRYNMLLPVPLSLLSDAPNSFTVFVRCLLFLLIEAVRVHRRLVL